MPSLSRSEMIRAGIKPGRSYCLKDARFMEEFHGHAGIVRDINPASGEVLLQFSKPPRIIWVSIDEIQPPPHTTREQKLRFSDFQGMDQAIKDAGI